MSDNTDERDPFVGDDPQKPQGPKKYGQVYVYYC